MTVKYQYDKSFIGEVIDLEAILTVANAEVEAARAAEVHVCSQATDKVSMGDFHSFNDKLETICQTTLLATPVLPAYLLPYAPAPAPAAPVYPWVLDECAQTG